MRSLLILLISFLTLSGCISTQVYRADGTDIGARPAVNVNGDLGVDVVGTLEGDAVDYGFSIDTTEITTTTWGDNSNILWTFNDAATTSNTFQSSTGAFIWTTGGIDTPTAYDYIVTSNKDTAIASFAFVNTRTAGKPYSTLACGSGRGTWAARTKLLTGDVICAVSFDGFFTGANISGEGARIQSVALEDWNGSNNKGADLNFLTSPIAGSPGIRWTMKGDGNFHSTGGGVWINSTGDPFNTGRGLIIKTDGTSTQVITLSDSNVAHGITGFASTTTFGMLSKAGADTGGVILRGFCEITACLELSGLGVTDNTTKSASALGYINVWAAKKSGTSVTGTGTNANLLAIHDWSSDTRWLVDKEGDTWQSGTPSLPAIKSTTGVRYICVDTAGLLVSQAAPCVGT